MSDPIYYRLHIPSGMRDTQRFADQPEPYVYSPSRIQQLELVNKWNRLGDGVWLFWLSP